jgi:dihydroxyacetone kinase DhaKLM complex PTS-EIIA-like component DhaM
MPTVFLIFFLFFVSSAQAKDFGLFMVVKGKVRIENSQGTNEAKVGSKIHVGDTVVTEQDSRAKIVMSDRNIINVSPSTKLKIEVYSQSGANKNVSLSLIEGRVRNNVEQKYNNEDSKFEVRTATAVAGVRGTQFVTSYDPKSRVTEVVTIKGEVMLQRLTAAGLGDVVSVKRGQRSQADAENVAPPTAVPEAEIKKMDSDTSVKGKEPEPGTDGGKSAGTPPPLIPPLEKKAPLQDLINTNDQVKKGPVERKYDKSKVKVITQPN